MLLLLREVHDPAVELLILPAVSCLGRTELHPLLFDVPVHQIHYLAARCIALGLAAGVGSELAQCVQHQARIICEGLQHLEGFLVAHHHHLHRWLEGRENEVSHVLEQPVAVDGVDVLIVDVQHHVGRTDLRLVSGFGDFLCLFDHGKRNLLRRPVLPVHLFGEEREVGDCLLLAVLEHHEVLSAQVGDRLARFGGHVDHDVDHRELELVDKGQPADRPNLALLLLGRRMPWAQRHQSRQHADEGQQLPPSSHEYTSPWSLTDPWLRSKSLNGFTVREHTVVDFDPCFGPGGAISARRFSITRSTNLSISGNPQLFRAVGIKIGS